jgi:acyl-CoA dehydrogenase
MPVDFALDPKLQGLCDRVRAFVENVVRDYETDPRADAHGPADELRVDLQAAARAAGVFAPTVPPRHGGLGLDHCAQAVILEEAGRSLLGPVALNCAAPDEGNILLLDKVADDEQRDRYLEPLARGVVRSAFAMTEPAPGAGSDPALLATTARREDGKWRIDGRKWFITGATGAGFTIVMARTGDAATMFLVDADTPGMRIVRRIDTLDAGFSGGHAEVEFRNCLVGADAVLGTVGEGFRHAQVRLGPARLTHCMRWLGLALRAHETAVAYAAERPMFGTTLGDLGMAQALLADNEIDIAASRGLILQAAWALDIGEPARQETSVAKVFVAEATSRIADRSLQLCGAFGVSEDGPLARIFREVRPFRIYDGPSEVHRASIARRAIRRARAA